MADTRDGLAQDESMDVDSQAASSSSSGIPPDQDALAAVRAQVPPRRRRRAGQPAKASPRQTVSQDDVQSVMAEYQGLQEACLNQHGANAPQLLAANQALLAQKVLAIQQSRGLLPQQTAEGTRASRDPGAASPAPNSTGRIADSPGDHGSSSSDSSGDEGLSGAADSADERDEAGGAQDPAGNASKQQRPRRPYYAWYNFTTYGGDEGQHSTKVKAIRLDDTSRLPGYFSWSEMSRNQLAADLPPGTKLFHPDQEGETVPINDPDIDAKPWFDANGFTHDYALRKLAEAYHDRLDWLLRAITVGLRQEEEDVSVTSTDLADRLLYLWQQELKPAAPTDGSRRQAAFTVAADVMHQQYCVRCKVYGCPQHDGAHIMPGKKPQAGGLNPQLCSDSCWMKSPAVAASAAQTAEAVETGPAGQRSGAVHLAGMAAVAEASKVEVPGQNPKPAQLPTATAAADDRQQASLQEQRYQAGGSEGLPRAPQLSAYEEGLLQQGLDTFGSDACKLALLLLDRTCSELQLLLQQRGLLEQQQEPHDQGTAEEQPAAKRRKKRGGRPTTARRHVEEQRWRSGEHHTQPPYQPCNCVGPCQKGSCSCIDNATFCEKFCACVSCQTQRDCTFQGCKCSTGCRITTCPCSKASRECDPDLCRSCTATAGTAASDSCCGNMNIRLNRHKRLQLGLSTVAGWGAFIAEHASKGDFIGEYVGELLTQEEADRRGAAYDKSDNSYLFGINTNWVLDARQSGNKLRFANHSSRPNCRTRVMMVDGDHRVGLYAEQDLEPGEELFYNYMYALDNAPDWAVAA